MLKDEILYGFMAGVTTRSNLFVNKLAMSIYFFIFNNHTLYLYTHLTKRRLG